MKRIKSMKGRERRSSKCPRITILNCPYFWSPNQHRLLLPYPAMLDQMWRSIAMLILNSSHPHVKIPPPHIPILFCQREKISHSHKYNVHSPTHHACVVEFLCKLPLHAGNWMLSSFTRVICSYWCRFSESRRSSTVPQDRKRGTQTDQSSRPCRHMS